MNGFHSHIQRSETFSSRRTSSLALTTGGIGLMVGSLLLSVAAFSVFRLNQAIDVSVNANAWSWVTDCRFGIERGQELVGPLVSEGDIPEHELMGPRRPLFIADAPVLATPKKHLAKGTPTRQQRKSVVVPVDSPKITIPTAVVKTEAGAPAQDSLQASPSELTTLRTLHQALRGKFLLAMTTQPKETPAAIAVEPEPIRVQKHRQTPEPTETVVGVVAAKIEEVEHSLSETQADPSENQEIAEKASPAAAEAQTEPVVGTAQMNEEVADETGREPDAISATPAKVSEVKIDHDDVIQSAQAAPRNDYSASPTITPREGDQTLAAETAGKIRVASGSQQIWIVPQSVTKPIVPISPAPPAPSRVTTHGPTPTVAALTPQPAQLAPSLATQVTDLLATTASAPRITTEIRNDYPVSELNSQSPVLQTEAFDWSTPVSGGATASLAQEAIKGHGWVLSRAPDHWTTLARQTSEAIPLISSNTGKLLSTLVGATLQPEAAIVFGKVPTGWSVRLSGRSERPVFLNEKNQSISQSNLDGERYFAFLNVEPGAHLLYLADRSGVEAGAIGMATQSGVATYANLTQIHQTSFTGRVLDGSDARARPVSGARVRVLGARNAHVETDRYGRFTIENVLQIGDYPVYVETDSDGGYTHRYQLAPTGLSQISLYRLSPAAIQTWINQLEGAISPDSGIIVGALPSMLSEAKAKRIPSVRSIASNPSLRPETYTLSSNGQMQVGRAMDEQTTRFVSVQVPEGPAVAQITDTEQKTIWSEVIMVSPAVVNIVGPY